MEKGFLILLFVIFYNLAFSQTYSVSQIDSLVLSIDTSNYKQRTIEGIVTTKPGKDKGGSAETYYQDTLLKRLIKVELAQALYNKERHLTSVELTTFYYHARKLIMVKTSRFDNFGYPTFKKGLSSGTYYYQDDSLIQSKETGHKHGGIAYISIAETYRDRLFEKVFAAD